MDCEGCDGSGIRAPAHPSCPVDCPTGWIIVERCDLCEKFPSDFEAALSRYKQVKTAECSNKSEHIIALNT